jgi:hypothetical protein
MYISLSGLKYNPLFFCNISSLLIVGPIISNFTSLSHLTHQPLEFYYANPLFGCLQVIRPRAFCNNIPNIQGCIDLIVIHLTFMVFFYMFYAVSLHGHLEVTKSLNLLNHHLFVCMSGINPFMNLSQGLFGFFFIQTS